MIEKIRSMIDLVKEKTSNVIHRFSGIISHLCKFVSDSLEDLKNSLGMGVDKIIKAFYSLSKYFLELAENLTDEMFKFLVRFRSIANSKGFDLSKTEVKVPTVGFESIDLVGFNIPFPKIQSPEILLVVEGKKLK